MPSLLSQEEIDALLAAARERPGSGSQDGTVEAAAYDFRRPDRVSREQLQALQALHDRFARDVATSLAAYLRTGVEATVATVESVTFADFLASLPDPTVFYALALPPFDGLAALELNPAVASLMVDRLLGGPGTPASATRGLTEIEQHVVDAVVGVLLEDLGAAWRRVLDVRFKVHGRDAKPAVLHVASPGDAMVLVAVDVRIGEARGMLSLCLPAGIAARMPQGWRSGRRDPSPADASHLARNLARVTAPVTAVLRATLEARDILAVQPGDVLSLGRTITEPIEVCVWNTVKLLARPAGTGDGPGLAVELWADKAESEGPQ